MAGFKLLELIPIPVTCTPIVFIVSLNDDKDDMRRFDFNLASAPKVAIQQVVEIPSSNPAVGPNNRVLAYEADGKTPFKFGLRTVPVTMYLRGVKRPSAKPNDIGFEYSYYKDQAATQELCGATAVGTVVKVEPAFDVDPFRGASFQKRNKMLIDGEADAKVKVSPPNVVTPQWSTDDPLGVFSAPQSFQTHYDAGVVPTPPGGHGYVRVTLTGVNTNPARHAIQATIPVTLSAPTMLQLLRANPDPNPTTVSSASGKTILMSEKLPYEILDQNGASIHAETAYAKRLPVRRENIRAVLSSCIPAIQNWIPTGFKNTVDDWTDTANGRFTDTIRPDLPNGLIVDPQGQVIPAANTVILTVTPSHIWFLGVRKPGSTVVMGVREGCHNSFSSTVTEVTQPPPGGAKIKTEYNVKTT